MTLDAIGIVSKNPAKSIQFYKLLNIDLKQVGGPDHFEGKTPSGIRIMIDSAELMKKLNSNWKDPSGSGVILCFKQESVEKVDEIFSTILKEGYQGIKAPWDAFWGQRYASVCDPDGNQIDIFATL